MPHARNILKFSFKNYPAPLECVKQYTRLHSRTLNSKEPHRFLSWITAGLTWFCLRLSWKAAYNLGAVIGRLLYHLRIRRKVAMVNLDIVFGQSKSIREKEHIYKAAMINIGRLILNYIRLPHQPASFWQENVRIINMDILTDALKENRGVIALAAHLGIIDLAAGSLSQRGYPIAVVGKRIKDPFWDNFVLDSRLAMNVGTIRHRSSMKRIFKGLKVGEIIVMALDQNMRRKQGTFLNWMGRPASSVYASGYLAQKLKVPIVAGYCWQKGPQQFETIFTERVAWQSYPEDPQKEKLINAQAHADAVQRMILSHPEIWFWIHKRWRIQPDGIENPYK
jgi:KDO2-lipid IV(A) lauroyltransferase